MVNKQKIVMSLLFFPMVVLGETGNSSPGNNADNAGINYNASFIQGMSVDLAEYAYGNPVPEGVYTVTILVNEINRGKQSVSFKMEQGRKQAQACFTPAQISELGIITDAQLSDKPESTTTGDMGCYPITHYIAYAKTYYNTADLELTLTLPQANMPKTTRGYVDPSRWDAGVTTMFIDYNANAYANRSKVDGASDTTYNGNLNWTLGLNLGDWRIRNRSNSSWTSKGENKTKNIMTYVETDITPLKSRLTMGDVYTNSRIFDSYNLRGATLSSDTQMLPDTLNSYSPIIAGIAESNARVILKQGGHTLYETTVTPGPFELSDFGALSYGGNIQMVIIEADGREKIQDVIFSSPPMMMFPGVSSFGIQLGELNDSGINGSPKIAQGEYAYGINNFLSVYGGFQVAENYHSVAIGNALNTPLGGISLDMTHARSDFGDEIKTGDSFRINYSKLFNATDTNLTLSTYRYSTEGYYTFRDAVYWRQRGGFKELEGHTPSPDEYENSYYALSTRAKNQFMVNINQPVWDGGSITLMANYFDYWGDRPAGTQLTFGYNQQMQYFSYSLSYQRTKTAYDTYDDTYLANVNIPLPQSYGEQPLFSSVYLSAARDAKGKTAFQTSVSGSQGDENELNYQMGGRTNVDSNEEADSLTGSVLYRASVATIGSTASMDSHSNRQVSLSANGSIVAHEGGVTLGPSLGNAPFAIVEAQGADGAKFQNGYGTKVNSFGYAIVPNLTAYRENQIALDARNLDTDVDVMDDMTTVVPRAGSAIKVKIKTMTGKPVVLVVRDQNGQFLPIGTNLYGPDGEYLTIVGQAGMAYIRGWDGASGALQAKSSSLGECLINPEPSVASKIASSQNEITQLEVKCI
ncbi:MAG TPA: fimbrial biogenesis outer membrane usher protein [Morganella sp. (in: Bacteria)]|nr:fimbrial biogenesis outer membrane usher protein [Morganella sp. (in: enterobacteria)]